MTLRGRPPLAPLARAAAAFASDRTLPPRRPNETAAGFLRAIGDPCDAIVARSRRHVGAVPRAGSGDMDIAALLHREGRPAGNRPQALHRVCDGVSAGHEMTAGGGERRLHGSIKPYRLGFVEGEAD